MERTRYLVRDCWHHMDEDDEVTWIETLGRRAMSLRDTVETLQWAEVIEEVGLGMYYAEPGDENDERTRSVRVVEVLGLDGRVVNYRDRDRINRLANVQVAILR